MVLPIYAFGQPVLKKKAVTIDQDYPQLDELIDNMWETMYNANGVGLAAPQIGLGIRMFMVDTIQTKDKKKEDQEEGIKEVFINAEKIQEGGNLWPYEEGCLSIPDIHGDVERPAQIKLRYYDADWQLHEKVFNGINARVIQHEYDHIDGVLFVEKLKPLRKRRIKRGLEKIKRGDISPDYKMRFVRP